IVARRHSGDRLSDTRQLDDAVAPLVRRAQGGDARARDELLRRCHATVYRWALVHTGDPDDADDVAQEVLVRLYTRLDRYGGRSRFTTWLYQVTRNAAIGLGRRLGSGLRLARNVARRSEVESATRGDPVQRVQESQVRQIVTELFRGLRAVPASRQPDTGGGARAVGSVGRGDAGARSGRSGGPGLPPSAAPSLDVARRAARRGRGAGDSVAWTSRSPGTAGTLAHPAGGRFRHRGRGPAGQERRGVSDRQSRDRGHLVLLRSCYEHTYVARHHPRPTHRLLPARSEPRHAHVRA